MSDHPHLVQLGGNRQAMFRTLCRQLKPSNESDRQRLDDCLSQAIEAVITYHRRDPGWLDDRFPTPDNLVGYVYVAARNIYRRPPPEVPGRIPERDPKGELTAFDRETAARKAGETLEALMGSLNAELVLRRADGDTYEDIAEALSTSHHLVDASDVFVRIEDLKRAFPGLARHLADLQLVEPDIDTKRAHYRVWMAKRRHSADLDPRDLDLIASRFAGEPYESIARRTGDSSNTLRQRWFRLRRRHGWIDERAGGEP